MNNCVGTLQCCYGPVKGAKCYRDILFSIDFVTSLSLYLLEVVVLVLVLGQRK